VGQGDNYTKNLSGERIGFRYFLLQQEIKIRLNRTHEAKICARLMVTHLYCKKKILKDKGLKEDFNLLFWRVFGVNQRVYEPEDVFKVKRDKQSDEKSYSNFLKSDNKLSNENYLQQSVREIEIFDVLFIDYLLGNSSVNEFYIHQLKNIMFNYKMFKDMYVEEEKYINMFSFQIAFIMEKMCIDGIDASLFDKSLEENSMEPFISKCKSKTQCKTNEELSIKLSYASAEMKEKFKNNNKVKFDVISPETLKKDLSKWKKKREVPSFMKLLVIMNIMEQAPGPKKIGIFIQLIIVRALLHIQKEFKINADVKNKFIQQLKSFRGSVKIFL